MATFLVMSFGIFIYMSQLLCVEPSAQRGVRQRMDGDQLAVADFAATRVGVTFIPFLYGRAPLVATKRVVLALFCTPTSWGR